METNNKLREALGKILWCLDWMFNNTDDKSVQSHLIEPIALAKAALAEPVKNYEVGTVGQQDERFYAFCHRYYNEVGLCDKSCPCRDFNMLGGACSIVWGQLPYVEKEGGAK